MLTTLVGGQLIWNIPLFIGCLCLLGVYLYIILKHQQGLGKGKPIFFALGLFLLYLLTGSPLLQFSNLSFSFHMLQMSLLLFMIPPLILFGLPQKLHEKVMFNKPIFTPHISLMLFSVLLFIYHLPFMLIFISNSVLLRFSYITILFILSFHMWSPLVFPNSCNASKRKTHLSRCGLYIMPACLLFIVSGLLDNVNNPFLMQLTSHLCLPAERMAQFLPSPFNTKYDQMFAGVLMMGLHKASLKLTATQGGS